jgi:hypothetical protein
MSRAAARIQHRLRLDPYRAQTLQHALRNFAVEKLRGIQRAAAGKLLGDMLRTQAQGRRLWHVET